jgi:serine protease Do
MRDPRRFLLLLIIGVLAGYAWWRYDHRSRISDKFTPAAAPKLSLDDVKVLAAIDAEYTKLIESVVPSVVSITSSRTFYQRAPITIEDLLAGRQRYQEARSTSLGSGVIVSKEGHILTNHHVIKDMTEVRVLLSDGRNLPARIIGSDPGTDLAVLKVDDSNLEPLSLGDSDNLRVGQQVFAVGNPYGLDETVTRGIVSAIGRRTRSGNGVDAIQHDAAVNPGNSGGPLLNLRGEIIGINSAIYTRTGGFQGISFAIPSNAVRQVMNSILERGRIVRPYLGAVMQNLSPAIASYFGLRDTNGALISEVTPGSPAHAAGLQPGDVVRSFGGKDIKNVTDLDKAVTAMGVGASAEVSIVRSGQVGHTTLRISEVPDPPPNPPR